MDPGFALNIDPSIRQQAHEIISIRWVNYSTQNTAGSGSIEHANQQGNKASGFGRQADGVGSLGLLRPCLPFNHPGAREAAIRVQIGTTSSYFSLT